MGFFNDRSVVLDMQFKQYEATGEMLSDYVVVAGSPTLGISTPDSIHPVRCMEFVGVSATCGVAYSLGVCVLEPADAAYGGYETSVWVQMDAGLAGSQVKVSGGAGSATYAMPSDGSWVELGHTYQRSGLSGNGTSVQVELVSVVGTGTFRIARITVRRLANHAEPDLSTALVLPFLSDDDTLTPSWQTSVVECYNGAEARTQKRTVPSAHLTSDYLITDEEESALLEQILYASAGRLLLVPFWPDAFPVLADTGTDTTDQLRKRFFTANGKGMFWRSPFDYEVVTIPDSDGTLVGGWMGAWPAGSLLVPMLPAFLPVSAPVTLPTPETRKLSCAFDVSLHGQGY